MGLLGASLWRFFQTGRRLGGRPRSRGWDYISSGLGKAPVPPGGEAKLFGEERCLENIVHKEKKTRDGWSF